MAPALILPDSPVDLTAKGIANTLAVTAPSSLDITSCKPTYLPAAANAVPLAELDASQLQTTLTTSPRNVPAIDSPEMFNQKTCTDHMVTCSWTASQGWAAPELRPFGPLSLAPTASCLHYGTECFEGMKLYRGFDGKLRLFRPQRNCDRMLRSATRIALPGFEPQQLLQLITRLCEVDGPKWLPKGREGMFLYIRPAMIADDPALGVQQPKQALLFIIMSCFAAMDNGVEGMRLLSSEPDMIRAWPGGFGWAKVGANYGPTLLAQGEARRRGYGQVLWLYPGEGEDEGRREITEAGASNFFVVWRNQQGALELVTAPLDGKIILDGVTRRSILDLARERLGTPVKTASDGAREALQVVERKLYMDELVAAFDEGRLVEAFVVGTAYFVSPVSFVSYAGKDMVIPRETGATGFYTGLLKNWMSNIMWGKEEHEWAVVINEK